jgi:DNA-binding SARP family transcriptional activator/Tfp pilus assembly protein PilF
MPAPANNPLAGRVTIVLAAAGYGKTRAVRAWLGSTPNTWHRGPDIVDRLPSPTGDRVTVVDDLHLVPADALAGWFAPVLTASSRLILVSRRPVPAAALRSSPDLPVEVGPAQLALSQERIARLLRRRYGLDAPELAAQVHRLTDGWPALARQLGAAFAADAARLATGRTDEEVLTTLAAPGTPVAGYLGAEVLAALPPAGRRLLTDAIQLGSISADLATALGHTRPEWTVGELARLGLLVLAAPGPPWYRPVPVVAAVAASARRRSAGRPSRVLAVATDWHRRNDRPAEALRLRLAAGDHTGCASIVAGHGAELLARGAAAEVVAAIRALPMEVRDDRTKLLLAEALEIIGHPADAVAVYAALAGDAERLPPQVAWRYGVAVYLWGDPHDALDILRRGVLGREDTADEAMLLAWTAAAHWLAGDAASCRDGAARAHRAARAARDDRALATAHVALALCANLDGDPAALQMHYARALELAEAAGDVVQAIRIRANRTAGLEREARFSEALEMVRPAVALAERCGHASMLAMSLCNEATMLQRLGHLDDAVTRHRRSVELYQRIGSDKVAYPLNGLGDVHRQRGRISEARTAYEEAVRAATRDGNRQSLVPALAGLARVIDSDPRAAAEIAARAEHHASGPQRTAALLAAGWVALRSGDRSDARRRALSASDSARRHRDHTGLAEALELHAAASEPPDARRSLVEALAIWRDAGAVLDADRVSVALAGLPGACDNDRLAGRLATARLSAAGVVLPGAAPPVPHESANIQIRVLGGFTVLIDGAPVPASTWRSRKARDLLRILVARRGRPVPREELAELLWGEAAGDPGVGHRLAVALSTARAVLDPRRCAPPDRFISAGPGNLWANLETLDVDVEAFLRDARDGLRLLADGVADDAQVVLAAAERAYTGDVYADDPYDEWAQPLRDHVRAVHVDVLHALADLGRRHGRRDEAVRHLQRVIDAEPYDERAHRILVGVLADEGRHGEARRAFARYATAMREIGLPSPDEARLLAARRVPA